MKYRNIGTTALQSSEIGFGCMSLLKASTSEAETLVNKAIEKGINYFDTADLYDRGLNEQLIGNLLKPVRNKIILATKVGNEWRTDGSGWDWNPRKSYIIKAVDESLKRLQTDYIDLYQLHGGTMEDAIDETIDAFEGLVQMGKIRYYGLSSIRPNVIKRFVELSNLKSVMMQYSLLDRRPEEEILTLLKEKSVSVMARGVLAQGLLVNKPAKDYLSFSAAEIRKTQELLQGCVSDKITNTGLAIQYVLSNAAVATVVIGFRTVGQLKDVLEAVNQEVPQNILEKLSKVLLVKKYIDHR